MRTAVALVSLLLAPLVWVASADRVEAAPAGDDEVVAFVVNGVGNGHGRGLSQWGTYGRALAGQSWQQILDTYYGGTSAGTRAEPNLRVRLTDWDGAGTLGVISRPGSARWRSAATTDTTNYTSLYTTETAPNRFTVFGVTSGHGCPGGADLPVPFVDLERGDTGAAVADMQRVLNHLGFGVGPADGIFGPMTESGVTAFQTSHGLAADGLWRVQEAQAAQDLLNAENGTVPWVQLAVDQPGPIVFTTTVDQASSAAGDVLGVCEDSGSVNHYRGTVELIDVSGTNRVVNVLDVESYLRGVVPKEVPPSWGNGGGGTGMNALRAQSVAARSYGMSQSRYSYAETCDTSSCQVYGGSAVRISATTANYASVEHPLTDAAIADTSGTVRIKSGSVVSTEFSASNGPRTAGGAFPSVNDPFDDQPGNPNHRWTRVIDADDVRSRYGLSSANGVRTAPDPDSPFEGIWANEVQLGNGSAISAWSFRNAFDLPAPGFELVPINRSLSDSIDFAFIGDSVGVSVTALPSSPFRVLTEGVFAAERYDSLASRRTQGGTIVDGVEAAGAVPVGTGLVVVELGYNDAASAMPGRIDALMQVLRDRDVGVVAWVMMSERRSQYAASNQALRDARSRWGELVLLDWEAASDHRAADRWFDDEVHLTATGRAEFSQWLRGQILPIAADGYTPPAVPRPVLPGFPLRVPVVGVGGVPGSGVAGVALNVTVVEPVAAGWARVWPC
ncbi:MAG: SpoIID/LytB domain-containing protein, partial [Ilumatobacter sp.]|uniref:SpoIID/LytB domain-containing protein n=1 Tax=Ilumatobacter sp. TaxID=1967498 RepID=UPI00262243C5